MRLPRTAVSRVLTSKCHGTDLSQGSRIQIRANGSSCLTRDTKEITDEHQQDSCPLSRRHAIRSNYMGKSIEAKKKVRVPQCLVTTELNCELTRARDRRFPLRQFDAEFRVHAFKVHIASSLSFLFPPFCLSQRCSRMEGFRKSRRFLRNRGIWSEYRKSLLLRRTLGHEMFISLLLLPPSPTTILTLYYPLATVRIQRILYSLYIHFANAT